MVILVDGEERGTGTAARKHLARNIAANVALASLREEDPWRVFSDVVLWLVSYLIGS